MIYWLASFPRSGNSFFRRVCRYNFKFIVYSKYTEKKAPVDQETLIKMAKSPEPYVVKTHDLPMDDAPAIYLVRDGRDALISYAWWT